MDLSNSPSSFQDLILLTPQLIQLHGHSLDLTITNNCLLPPPQNISFKPLLFWPTPPIFSALHLFLVPPFSKCFHLTENSNAEWFYVRKDLPTLLFLSSIPSWSHVPPYTIYISCSIIIITCLPLSLSRYLDYFLITTITNYHKFTALKEYKFLIFQFCPLDIKRKWVSQAKTKVSSGLCFFLEVLWENWFLTFSSF